MKYSIKIGPVFSAGALLFALLATSCSVDNPAEQQLSLHPVQESRMSDKPLPGYVPTGVWRVMGRSGNVVYLVGTCHVVPDSQIPFPSTYYAAYQQSRKLFFEIDPDSIASKFMLVGALPGVIGFMIDHDSEMRSAEGQTLSQSLSPKTVKLLRAHYGSEYASMENLSPLGLIMKHELMGDTGPNNGDTGPNNGDTGPNKGGVDDLFTLLARRDHKKITALDGQSVGKVIKPVMEASLSKARRDIAKKGPDAAVRESILEARSDIANKGPDAAVRESILENGGSDTNWRYGISDRQAAMEFASMKKDEPALYQMLIPQRNNQWIKPITRAIEGKHATAVFVGALHLPGPDGLLALLRKEGYQPEQMYGIDRPKPVRSKINNPS